jgi:hypothetical protein
MAAESRAVKQPPSWATALLRALLPARDRDTITGDLFEEYSERLPRSAGVARNWYIRQVLSFVRARNLGWLLLTLLPQRAIWAAPAGLLQFAIAFVLPHSAGVPLGTVGFGIAALALAIAGLVTAGIAPSSASRTAVRISGFWFATFALAAIGTMSPANFTPVPGVILFLICVPCSAVQAAARTGRAGLGILAAVITASLAAILAMAAVSILKQPHPPFSSFIFLPGMGSILGAAGAAFGRQFGSAVSRRPAIVELTI